MAPIMGKAIKEVVKNQRYEIVDALYPVMGNMISKFVAETFKEVMIEINQKVQSTFSFEVIKRKIKAKIKGISETELLLQSSSRPYIIQSVFLIHKETGILISERSASGIESIEPEMVASMLTAIRSFVNDWISKNSDNFELNEIEFGDSTIRLEVAGCCYLAVVLKGSINREGQQRIVKVLEHLVENNAQTITEFDGNTDSLPMEEITSKLDTLVRYQKDEKKPKEVKRWPLWVAGTLIIGITTWGLYKTYLGNSAEKIAHSLLYKDPYLNLYAIEAEADGSHLILRGRLPAKSLHERMVKNLSQVLPQFTIDSQVVLTEALPTHEQTFSLLKSIIDILNNDNGNRIKFQFKEGIVQLKGVIQKHHIHEKLLKNISALPGVLRVLSTLKEHPMGQTAQLFYGVGGSTLNEGNKALLDHWIETNKVQALLEFYNNTDLLIIGYSDIQGNVETNAYIAKKRAQNVINYLVKQGLPKSRMVGIGVPAPPKNNIRDVAHSGRSTQIKWVKR